MQPFRCRVTGTRGSTPLSPAKAPAYCSANPSSCTSGAKQMIFWNQAEGNNVEGSTSPGYNTGMGWTTGRQTDIFTNGMGNTNTGGNGTNNSSSKGISSGAIVGIVVGVVALFVTFAFVSFCIYRRRRGSSKRSKGDGECKIAPRNETDIIDPFVATLNSGTRTTSVVSSSLDPTTPTSAGLTSSRPDYHRKNMSQTTTASTQPFSSSGSHVPPSSSSDHAPAGTKLQRERDRQMVEREVERPAVNQQAEHTEQEEQSPVPERHIDGGPVDGSTLERRGSGRLPPAYADIPR
ncbi:hypothetical protein PQX77_017097 [Marasmius sp. AFHP31]|nr:hypothetical protein PQX77_017097 [Marasmius sp. AFHP31]